MTLLRFWHNHGMLGLHTQHPWFTVEGGARSYVRKLTAPFQDRIRLGARAARLRRDGGRVHITDADGATQSFDKVILACHADQALALLADPTGLESRLLREFNYQPNTVTLHTDDSFMPRNRRAWASWNARLDADANGGLRPTTHYWMNRLQGVSPDVNYFVSLNCHERIAPDKVVRRIEYEHPLFNLEAIEAQADLPRLNQTGPDQTTYYAGAWFKYGFHEDGFSSALDCARAVTGEPLWS
jgi:predicted NAD/FAD-binding protein